MKQSSQPNGANPVKAIFEGAGQRVATKFNGALSVMVYDAMGKLVAEYGQTAPTTASIQYIMADHQGSTRLVTDRSGVVVSRHDYQPFGEELASTIGMRAQTPAYGTSDNVRQKYAGMETDDGTNMAHTLWRKYDGQSGRWTSPDPYGGSMTTADPQSFNRYTYVNNDPVNLIDPSGLTSVAPHIGPIVIELLSGERIEFHLRDERRSNEEKFDLGSYECCDSTNPEETNEPDGESQQSTTEVTIDEITIFTGTFPIIKNSTNSGKAAVNPNGNSSEQAFGFNFSVNLTLTTNGKPVKGARIYERVNVDGESVVSDKGKLSTARFSYAYEGPISRKPTNKRGKTTDGPLGANNVNPFTSVTITQTLYTVNKKGVVQELVTNTITGTFDARIVNNRVRGTQKATVVFSNRNFSRTINVPAPTRGIN